MVVMDRQDYINKANHLLNQSTYKSIAKDPTNSIKNKVINILKRVKTKTGLYSNTYKSMYPNVLFQRIPTYYKDWDICTQYQLVPKCQYDAS